MYIKEKFLSVYRPKNSFKPDQARIFCKYQSHGRININAFKYMSIWIFYPRCIVYILYIYSTSIFWIFQELFLFYFWKAFLWSFFFTSKPFFLTIEIFIRLYYTRKPYLHVENKTRLFIDICKSTNPDENNQLLFLSQSVSIL